MQESVTNNSTEGHAGHGRQYLSFILAGEEYGVDILNVQCIQGWTKATPIPGTPEHVLGIINLRGTVVPVVDLRKCFALESIPYDKLTVVLIVKVPGQDRERTVGIVVDAMSEVYTVADEAIQTAPTFGGAIDTDFIQGITTIDDRMVILVDIERLINFGALGFADSVDVH